MKLDYVEVWYSEQWNGWYWTAFRADGSLTTYGEYSRRSSAERGAERWVAREYPDFELGSWVDA